MSSPIYWHAFPVQRGGKVYYRTVWKLFGVPVWFWDRFERVGKIGVRTA